MFLLLWVFCLGKYGSRGFIQLEQGTDSFRILDLESMYDFKSLTHITSYFPTRPEFSLRWLVIASHGLSFDHPAIILISRSNGMSSLSLICLSMQTTFAVIQENAKYAL